MKYFNYKDFNQTKLIKLKKNQNISIGIALPVLNEDKTLKKTIDIIRGCGDLVDELIVVDSESTDKSEKICKNEQVPFIKDIKVSRDFKIKLKRGKGWNLWASLFYLKTDVIIWIDSDIENFSKNFVLGMIGPFLQDKKIQFTKGHYERPKNDARVTEIMVRPVFNIIFNKLEKFIQPLSGEYGGRRKFLEKINFTSGYSVESAVLIQAVKVLRDAEIAQVYLGKRIHSLQSVASLGRMASSIFHFLVTYIENEKNLKLKARENTSLIQYKEVKKGAYKIVKYDIADAILPAMKNIKKYEKEFKR